MGKSENFPSWLEYLARMYSRLEIASFCTVTSQSCNLDYTCRDLIGCAKMIRACAKG